MLNRRKLLKWMAASSTAAATGPLLPSLARAAEPITLDVLYAFPAFAKFHEPIAQEFMKRQSDIKIQFRAPAASYDEGHQTMLRQAVTNQLPDVYYSGYHLLGELVRTLVKRKQITEVAPMLDKEDAAWRKANYADAILALGKVDGKIYGLAFNASLPIIYYNEQLVRSGGGDPNKMPDTWEGMIALAAQIKAKNTDTAGLAYNIHDWPDDWLFRSMVLQSGGQMLNASETECGFAGPVGLKVMRYVRRFVTEANMPLIDWDQSRQQFIAGKIGIFADTPARLRQVTDLIGTKFTLRTAVFPIDDKANGGLPTGGNAAIITARDAAKQRAAWEFLKFVTGPEAQKIVVEGTGYMPTNLRALAPELLGNFYDQNPNFRTVYAESNRAKPWQGYPANSVRIWRAQRDIINAVMRGTESPEAGLDRLVKESNTLMKA
ncbi:MAG: ABC transporter substrate-binding protein [Pseudomonadota bacterium]|nr:ABC transporter substrate-binding protein [Pseudomonadota bacterium]